MQNRIEFIIGQDGGTQQRCPVCQNNDCEPILTVTVEEAAQHFVTGERDRGRHDDLVEIIKKLWSGETCNIYRCRDCLFGFSSPFVAGNSSFYNAAYPKAAYPKIKWEFLRTIKALETDDTRKKLALEIGAGSGFFLDLISKRFFDKNRIKAIEFNETARGRLQQKGYNIITGDIYSPDLLGSIGKIDYVFMFQVLEHMDSLDDLFSGLRKIICPGGKMFIAVPNATRIEYQEKSGSLLDMPPNHIGRWTLQAFEVIAARHGFEVVGHEIEPFALCEYVWQDLFYSHKRCAQQRGTFSNFTQRISSKKLRRLVEVAAAAILVPRRLVVWIRASWMEQMGGSFWVQLQRENRER
jgi:SAM-dependent methyltransferase